MEFADDGIGTDLGPVIVLMVGRGCHRVYRWPQASANDWRPFICALGVLLHVLGEIRLLGVALAAILTDVRLEVFRFLVLGYVLEEARLVGETFIAGITLVGLVGLMTAAVRLEITQLTECLGAAWMSTFVGLVASVSANVLL